MGLSLSYHCGALEAARQCRSLVPCRHRHCHRAGAYIDGLMASTGVVMTPGMMLSTGVAHVGDRRTDGITIDNRTI